MKKFITTLACIFAMLINLPHLALAAENKETSEEIIFEPLTVKATKTEVKDTEATFASEVYTHEEIIESGATSLYDFLNQNTSVIAQPNFGNPFQQALDLRGFGLSSGFESVVISVNGRKVNNIDLAPQNLSFIPIQNIERIEITKGSGSVIYGDGATAGSIQIYTRDSTETSIAASVGNFGRYTSTINTGFSSEKIKFSAFGDTYNQRGFSDPGPDGNRDNGEKYSYKVKLQYSPTESSEVFIEKDATDLEYRYPNALTQATFESNPGSSFKTTVGPTNFTHQLEDSDNISLGGKTKLGEHFEATFNFFHHDKDVVFSSSSSNNLRIYDTNVLDGNIKYLNGPWTVIAGGQSWDGERRCDSCFTPGTAEKKNTGLFVQGYYEFASTTLSLGARKEWVDFTFNTNNDSESFESIDIGFNHSLSDQLNLFSNFNYAFQTPDVDMFFDSSGNFNGFIETAKVKTLNIGLNHITPKSKIKLVLFGSKLEDEIYFNPITFKNTNIDRSSKYGVELQNQYSFNDSWSASLNYSYIRAIIDREDSNLNCTNRCAGNEIPGVSNHNLTFGINYDPTKFSRIILAQNYRSDSYSLNDFANSLSQKNKAYIRTDLSYRHSFKKADGGKLWNGWGFSPRQIDFSAKVENLFERSQGVWLKNDAVWPTNFTRNFFFGAEFKF